MNKNNFSSYTSQLYHMLYNNKTNHEKNDQKRCNQKNIQLDKYQRFVSKYLFHMKPNDVYGILLFHNTGSGKTCTSVDIIAKYFIEFPSQKYAYVILPTKKDVIMYVNQFAHVCPSIRKQYTMKMNVNGAKNYNTKEYYTIQISGTTNDHTVIILDMKTYTRARKRDTVKPSIPGIRPSNNIFESNMVIVDEVDVLLRCESVGYKTPSDMILGSHTRYKPANVPQTLLEDMQKVPSKIKNQLLINYNHTNVTVYPKSRQLVMMTATPYIDDPNDIFHLLKCIKPSVTGLNLFEGTISYIDNKTDYTLYPYVSYIPIPVKLNTNYKNKLSTYTSSTKNHQNIEKLISVECTGPKCRTKSLQTITLEDVPKLSTLINVISQFPTGKHLIYIHEKHMGSRIVSHILNTYTNHKKIAIITSQNPNKSILQQFNRVDNIHGDIIKILIIQGKSFVRASTFKAVRHLHILTPLVDPNEHNQLVGRVSRRCSHSDLPADEWSVNVFMYHFDSAEHDNQRTSANEKGMIQRFNKVTQLNEMIQYAKFKSVDRELYTTMSNGHKSSLMNMPVTYNETRWGINNYRWNKGIPPTNKTSNNSWMVQ